MQVSATEAKNRFGYYCSQAKIEPVIIEKDGRPDTVMLDFESYQALKEAARPKSLSQRQQEFNERYKDWIREQNEQFEKHGLWCDGLVTWMEQRHD